MLDFNNPPDNLFTLFKIEKRENSFSAIYADYFQQQGFAIPQWTDSLQNVTENHIATVSQRKINVILKAR